MKHIHTDKAAPAIGPYSQGIIVGNLLYTSGQIGFDADGILVSDTVGQQTERVIENLKQIAQAAGTDLTNTVKTTCFLADMEDFADFNEIYAKHFTEKPARSCIQAARLPKDVLVEIEAIIEIP